MEPLEVTLSLDVERRIDALCDRFEFQWHVGENPSIEEYLRPFPAPLRGELLRALLPVELELRARGGRVPSADECRARFPAHVSVVTEIYLQHQ